MPVRRLGIGQRQEHDDRHHQFGKFEMSGDRSVDGVAHEHFGADEAHHEQDDQHRAGDQHVFDREQRAADRIGCDRRRPPCRPPRRPPESQVRTPSAPPRASPEAGDFSGYLFLAVLGGLRLHEVEHFPAGPASGFLLLDPFFPDIAGAGGKLRALGGRERIDLELLLEDRDPLGIGFGIGLEQSLVPPACQLPATWPALPSAACPRP